jgi:hypothetical protein
MADWLIKVTMGVVLALLAHWVAFLRLKWKLREDRKEKLAEIRRPIYSKGLKFVYDVELNQINFEELDSILKRWTDWFPLNVIYLPPSIIDAILGAMNWTSAVSMDLHNRDSNRETVNIFKEKLQNAKMMLLESKDIGWLPKDLR